MVAKTLFILFLLYSWCMTVWSCAWCRARELGARSIKPVYKCTVHGPFRTYNDYLSHLKNWCQLVVTIMIIPLTLILETLKVTDVELRNPALFQQSVNETSSQNNTEAGVVGA